MTRASTAVLLILAASAVGLSAAFTAASVRPVIFRSARNPVVSAANAGLNVNGLAVAAGEDDKYDDDDVRDDPSAELLMRAQRLREEAEALESSLVRGGAGTAPERVTAKGESGGRREASYEFLSDSIWTVSYRFAADPPPEEGEENVGEDDGPVARQVYYSGRVDIRLRSDGFTDIVGDAGVMNIRYTKFWGWDEEISNLDNEKYLMFPADVYLPESDRRAESSKDGIERFYFNARVELNYRTGEISLSDGTVTVKRDVKPPGGWGIFGGQGILAEFKRVGEFKCRPIALD